MIYQGREISEYESEYLAQQMGMLSMVKKIFMGIFLVGGGVFVLGGLANGELMICLLGLAFVGVICGAPLLYTSSKIKGMQEELDRRQGKGAEKANVPKETEDAATRQLVLTIAFVLGLALLFIIVAAM